MTADVATDDTGMDLAVRLFERYHGEIMAYLCRMVHDRQWAEDLTQEAFLKALQNRRHLPQVENHRAWLYRVATNLALNALKRRQRFAWLPWHLAGRDRTGQRELAGAPGRSSQVETCLAALPADLRAPLLLYAHYGFSVAEVAEALGISPGAVKTRLYRARQLFRQVYEREETG